MKEPGPGERADEPPGHSAGSAELVSRRRYEPVEWLTEVLDLESDGYEPDTQRIRTLVRERLNEGARGRRPATVMRLRLAGVPAGIAAAAVTATVAVAVTATVAVNSPATAPNAAGGRGGLPAAGMAGSPSPAPTGRAGSSAPGSPTVTKVPGTVRGSSPAAPPASGSASATGPALLTASGALGPASNASWSEERVNLTLTEPVATFQLTIRVAPSPGLTSNNVWSNHDITAFAVNITSNPNGLVYTFTLKQGRTLPAGAFVIAAQFAHNGARDASGDTFEASAAADASAGSAQGVARGGF
jgi:hypothetical protein